MENLDVLLDTLLELQKHDEEIRNLENLCRAIPVEIEERRKELERSGEDWREMEAQLKELKVREHKIELDINSINEEIARYEDQKMQAKTNVAYQALENEIKNAKGRIDELMEKGIPLIEDIESTEERLEEMKVEYEKAENEFKVDETELLGKKAEAEERLQALGERREGIITGIPEDLKKRYQRIWNNKEGLAVVPIEGNVCSGCYGQITIQMLNEIKHESELRSCEHCGRIIYYREEVHEEQGN